MTQIKSATALKQRHFWWLAAVLVLVGGWVYRQQQTALAHPETALFERLDDSRVLFAEVLRSQDSEAAVAATLQAAGLSVERAVIDHPASLRYPPHRIATFTVRGYQHLACEGTLVLEFFNNRLMEADFHPDDPARYAPRMRLAYPDLKGTGTGHAEWLAPPLRMWSSVELAKSNVGRALGTEGMVLWQDTRLIAQRNDWDARYGSVPLPVQQ